MVSSTRPVPPSINIRVIDDQHAALIENIERLEQAMLAGAAASALGEVIGRVKECAARHCPAEEALMESYGDPLRHLHAIEHGKFFIRLDEMERIAAQGHPAAALQMLSRLRVWLENHIADWDAKLGRFLNSRGVV